MFCKHAAHRPAWHRRGLTGLALAALALLGALALAAPALAAVDETISYQGRLTDAAGEALTTTVDITFRIYDAASGGTALWTETHSGVAVDQGLYSVTLGATTPLALERRAGYYLGITVGADGEMTPRIALASLPFAQRPNLGKNTVLVAQTNGDYLTLTEALGAITDASADNRYLIKVAPGIYTGSVTMKAYVSIEGSGRGATVIQNSGGGDYSAGTVLRGADNAELRSLTVSNIGGGTHAVGIMNASGSPLIRDVAVSVSGSTNLRAVYNTGGSPTLEDCQLEADGGENAWAIHNGGSGNVALVRVTATALNATVQNVGVWNADTVEVDARSCVFEARSLGIATGVNQAAREAGGDATYRGCTFHGADGNEARGHCAASPGHTFRLYGCRLTAANAASNVMPVYAYSGQVKLYDCVVEGSHSAVTTGIDVYGVFSLTSSPMEMHAVRIRATGGEAARGITMSSGTLNAQGMWVSAEGGGVSTAGMVLNDSTATIANSAFHADGTIAEGGQSEEVVGVSLATGNANLTACTLVGENGTYNDGFYSTGSGTSNLVGCLLVGDTYPINNQSGSTLYLGSCQLKGASINNTATLACNQCYNENFFLLNDACE